MNDLIDTKIVEIEGAHGDKYQYRISRVPYLPLGRELCTQFITTAAPKIGDYKLNSELSVKMFAFIESVKPDGLSIRLLTPELVNQHVPHFLVGIRLEAAMLEHNLGFSVAEKISGILETLLLSIAQSTTQISTALREQFSQAEGQQSTNSERSTQ